MEMFAIFQVMLPMKRLPAVVASEEFVPGMGDWCIFRRLSSANRPTTVVTLVWAGFMRNEMATFQFALSSKRFPAVNAPADDGQLCTDLHEQWRNRALLEWKGWDEGIGAGPWRHPTTGEGIH